MIPRVGARAKTIVTSGKTPPAMTIEQEVGVKGMSGDHLEVTFTFLDSFLSAPVTINY